MEEQNQKTPITLADIAVAVKIIDVCAERGAFKGDEMANVGRVREKFAAFVKENSPETDEEEVEEETDEEVEE